MAIPPHSHPNLNSGILHKIKVIEIGHYISAPIVGMMLAEQGAEVIQIVNPRETSPDPVMDAILSRGKKCYPLDLTEKANRELLINLISVADIVIENYAPETLVRFGIKIEEIRALRNPRLISCSIPAFPVGDSRSDAVGYEGIAGMAGLIYEKPLSNPI